MNVPMFESINLQDLHFDNSFTRVLPADKEKQNFCRQVHNACYSLVKPQKAVHPQLVSYAHEVAQFIDLSKEVCESDQFLQIFSGNMLLPDMVSYATCYGGYQFGNWAGQLGDGRVINLGELINRQGQRWTLQLKGAGLTPYSRAADGLAVLRSSVREFLCSEAMYHLGVPTTRALSLVLSGEQVDRDMFYDGHPEAEPGAIVCRVAQSFTRLGSFEIFAARGELDTLQKLVNYTILTDFPELGKPSLNVYVSWFEEVCRRTAVLMVHWMRVGFVHGVMNTDNMSILGLTIDYGPYGWLENHDPEWTPNTTDATGHRYCYGRQPQIALWNLAQFANALLPLVKDAKILEKSLSDSYLKTFESAWQEMVAQKLGFVKFQYQTDQVLNTELINILSLVETDMTLFYRCLAKVSADTSSLDQLDDESFLQPFKDVYYTKEYQDPQYRARFSRWIRDYKIRIKNDNIPDHQRQQQMNSANPKFVLRNYLAQQAIDKALEGDYSLIKDLLEVLRYPYDEQDGNEKFAQKRPEWARHRAGCSMLSCSS